MPFRPTIEIKSIARDEEKFLTECGVDKYRSGNYNKGPHMMGFTSAEAKSLAEGKSYYYYLMPACVCMCRCICACI